MKILMCRPEFYGIEYEINPWMKIDHQVHHQQALHQWEQLYQTIINIGAEVELVEPVRGWPDMVFTANAGLVQKRNVILSRFKYPERQGELPFFETWFKQAGFTIKNHLGDHEGLYFEGAGDALFAGKTLFAGYGFRTDLSFYQQNDYFNMPLVFCELTNPYFYHLDTCFCPINDQAAIWYPPAFTPASQALMQEQIELIAVNEEEAKRFACNAVVLEKHIVLPSECPEITAILTKRSMMVHDCDMREFLKAGGACKCLTLRLT